MKRLRVRLLLLAIIPILLMLATGLVVYHVTIRTLVIEEWQERVSEQVAFRRGVVDDWIYQRRLDLVFFAQSPVWTNGQDTQRYRASKRFLELHGPFTAVVFADTTGAVRLDSSLPPPGTHENANVADRLYFQRALLGRVNVSRVITGRTSGRKLIVIAAPVLNDGDTKGVLIAPVSIFTLNNVVSLSDGSPTIETYLVDPTNHPITDISWIDATEADITIAAAALPPPTNSAEIYWNAAGQRVIGSSQHLENHEWRLVGEVPLDLALATFSEYNIRLLAATGFVLVLLLIAAVALASSIEIPVEQLLEMSTLIDKRDYEGALSVSRSPRAPRELANLQGAFRDMAHRLSQFVHHLQVTSITDPLTSLPNRRHFEAEIQRLVAGAPRNHPAGSLLLLDLDHFKQINDQRGHPAGDRILQGFAAVLRDTIRQNDLPARIGGEEFAVLAPKTSAPDAEDLATRIRRKTKETLGVTVSIGLTALQPQDETSGTDSTKMAFESADAALYESKRRGRDRVTVYEGDGS